MRSIYDNVGKGDIPAVLAVIDPKVEWVENEQDFLPHHGTHVGRDAVVANVFGMVQDRFEEFAIVSEAIHDAGDVVVMQGRAVGRTRAGKRLDAPACWVWTVRNGRAVRNVNYHDTDAWRLALT